MRDFEDSRSGLLWEEGPVYQILLCPACNNITLRKCYWHSLRFDPDAPVNFETLYPSLDLDPAGLPAKIQRAYDEAKRIRNIDANAYGVLLGRLIELVCDDRNAIGATLAEKYQ